MGRKGGGYGGGAENIGCITPSHVSPSRLRGKDEADNEAVESKGLSEDEDEDHAHEELGLLGRGARHAVADDADGESRRQSAQPARKPATKVRHRRAARKTQTSVREGSEAEGATPDAREAEGLVWALWARRGGACAGKRAQLPVRRTASVDARYRVRNDHCDDQPINAEDTRHDHLRDGWGAG
jgi:hypothetical protein